MPNSARSVDVSGRESIRSDRSVATPPPPVAGGTRPLTSLGTSTKVVALEAVISRVQKIAVVALSAMLVVVMLLSTLHLGVLIGEEIWKPPRWLIPVQGLLEIFGYFLLVLIGVELLETLKAYLRKDVIHVRVVLEVALIAMRAKSSYKNLTRCQARPRSESRALFLRWPLRFISNARRRGTQCMGEHTATTSATDVSGKWQMDKAKGGE